MSQTVQQPCRQVAALVLPSLRVHKLGAQECVSYSREHCGGVTAGASLVSTAFKVCRYVGLFRLFVEGQNSTSSGGGGRGRGGGVGVPNSRQASE